MRIFALETDMKKLTQSFLSKDEQLIACARFHGFLFFLRSIIMVFKTIVLIALAIGAVYLGIPLVTLTIAVTVTWIIFVGFSWLRAFIDWQFDELVISSEKLVIVNQSSLFRQEIRQMNLENLASVRARTQYWGLFPFGELYFDLKEGTGAGIKLGYIPSAQQVASLISDVLVQFQRRLGGIPRDRSSSPPPTSGP